MVSNMLKLCQLSDPELLALQRVYCEFTGSNQDTRIVFV